MQYAQNRKIRAFVREAPSPGSGQPGPVRALTEYSYDSRGRLSVVYQGAGLATPLASFAYTAQGLPQSRAEGTGSSLAYSYDAVGRLTGIADAFNWSPANGTLTLAYNPAGQINSRTLSNDGYAWAGAYTVNRPYTTNGLNQYSAAGSASFSYDANGNLTSDGSANFTYDVENRLVAAAGSRTAALRYDPLGRLYEVIGATTTRFLYDGDALVAEYDGSGVMTRRYAHWFGADVPAVSYAGSGLGQPTQLHADHQGSIVALSNASGAATINSYDEYGIPGAGNSGRFQYTGQIWLPELGMYHYKSRIYSPTLGRFLQTDPIGYEDQFNLYAYVGNDPLNRTDPTGKWECTANATDCSKIRRYRAELHLAAMSARAQSGGRIMSADVRHLIQADGHLGREGDGRVQISNAALDRNTLGDTDHNGNIRLDLAQIERAESRGITSGAGALGHESSHSIMRQMRGEIGSAREAMYRELIGYGVQSAADQSLYWSGIRSQMWQPGMTDATRRRIIYDGAHASCTAYIDEMRPRYRGQNCSQ